MSAVARGASISVLDTPAELAEISAASGLERQRLSGEFISRRRNLINKIAERLCRLNFLDLAPNIEDIASEVRIEAVRMLSEMGSDPAKWRNWEGMLTVRARNVVSERLNSSEWTGVSGNSAARKRQRLIFNTQKVLLATDGVLYEGQQLVDKHNERMLATRADAARQSVLASLQDLDPVRVSSYGFDARRLEFSVQSVIDDDECPLVPSEAVALVKSVVARCRERSERLGRVAELFLGAETGEPVTSRIEISKTLGIDRDLARRAVMAVQEMAITALAEDFGITGA